ncbi:tRNA pseudouridine synthase 1 [Hypoxylon texense]
MASHDSEDPMGIGSVYNDIQLICECLVDEATGQLLLLFLDILEPEKRAAARFYGYLDRKERMEALLGPAFTMLLDKMALFAMTLGPSGPPEPSPDQSYYFFLKIISTLRRADHRALLDRHNRAIAQILKRFSNMVMAASEALPQTGNVIEHASINRMTMETECAGLIAEIEALLAINREIKALWIRGPLAPAGEDAAREANMDRQALAVAQLSDRVRALRDAFIQSTLPS